MSESEIDHPARENVLFTCWTTVSSEAEARKIADALVSEGIAACVQIDGPIQSVYSWNDQICSSTELRLWIKILASRLEQAQKRVFELHSYDTPQWIELEASKVEEKYLKWAKEASNFRGFQKSEPI